MEHCNLHYSSGAIGFLVHGICRIKEVSLLRRIINADRDTFEAQLDFDWLNYQATPEISEEFEQVLEEGYESNNQKMNKTAHMYYRTLKDKKALLHYKEEPLSPVEQIQMSKCLKIIPDIFHDFNDYPIMVVKSLGATIHAFADKDQGRIVVSKSAFKFGTKYLMSTLIEEYMHLKTGYGDQARELQTYLFDSIVTIIEDHVLKEPV